VSRRPWRMGATRITADEVTTLVARARDDIAGILNDVLDNEAGLAQIYAAYGQQPPPKTAAAAPGGEDSQVGAVCDRIAMLETALAQAAKPGGPSMRAAMYLEMARGFLFELRSGLTSRDLSACSATCGTTCRKPTGCSAASSGFPFRRPCSPVSARSGS